jgi:hypothetical protein
MMRNEQVPVWNEEGIFKVQRICQYLNEAKKYYADITEVRECIDWLKSLKDRCTWKPSEPNPYSGVSFNYNGHTWGMCARDNGVEILIDGEIKERVFLDNKPQGKSALEAIKEEKVDNTNKIEPKDYSSIDPYFGNKIQSWVGN